jgi:hypothetical protein
MTVSQPSSAASGVAVQKQKFNIYTMMLIMSFIALLIGCTALYLELRKYGQYPWWETGGSTATSQLDLPSSFDRLAELNSGPKRIDATTLGARKSPSTL